MSISTFINSLIPSFKKKNLLDDLDIFRKELADINLPCYQSAAEYFANTPFKDGSVKAFDANFKHDFKIKSKGSFVSLINDINQQLDSTIDGIIVMSKDEFAEDIIKEGITYRKANLIQLSETVGMFLRYSRMLLIWTYAQEQNAIASDKHTFSKGQLDWLTENRKAFLIAANVLALPRNDITHKVKHVTDSVHSLGGEGIIASAIGTLAIDPFNFLVAGTTFNVFYHARMLVADWQVDRYKGAQEEQRSLTYRLLNLKELNEGRKDAKIQLEISEIEGRLNRINASIAKKEAEYAR